MDPAGQPATGTAAQAQLLMVQQTPGHGTSQVLKQVNAPVHAAGVVTEQTPVVVLQHLPVQGEGVQVPPQ